MCFFCDPSPSTSGNQLPNNQIQSQPIDDSGVEFEGYNNNNTNNNNNVEYPDDGGVVFENFAFDPILLKEPTTMDSRVQGPNVFNPADNCLQEIIRNDEFITNFLRDNRQYNDEMTPASAVSMLLERHIPTTTNNNNIYVPQQMLPQHTDTLLGKRKEQSFEVPCNFKRAKDEDEDFPDISHIEANLDEEMKLDDSCFKKGRKKRDNEKESKKKRLVWTPELHARFVAAVKKLSIKSAAPKTILQMMKVEGLTTEHIKSHLQKYRLSLKKQQQEASSFDQFRPTFQSTMAIDPLTGAPLMGVASPATATPGYMQMPAAPSPVPKFSTNINNASASPIAKVPQQATASGNPLAGLDLNNINMGTLQNLMQRMEPDTNPDQFKWMVLGFKLGLKAGMQGVLSSLATPDTSSNYTFPATNINLNF